MQCFPLQEIPEGKIIILQENSSVSQMQTGFQQRKIFSKINMKIIICFLIIFCASPSEMCFENNELILTIDLVRELNIRHLIITIDYSFPVYTCYLKFFSFHKIYFTLMTLEEINNYVASNPYLTAKTLIVYTDANMFNELQDLARNLTQVNEVKMYLVSKFTWLVFLYDDIALPIFLSVPYDCQFILARPISESAYKLTEIYNILSGLVPIRTEVDYGTWDSEHGLNVLKQAIYFRRLDMNQITFTALLPDYQCDWNQTYRMLIIEECHYAQLLKDITKSLNFNYYEAYRNWADMYPQLLLQVDAFQDVKIFDNEYPTYLKYFPMNKLQLYIKYPEEKLMEGYYYLPFNDDTWYAILTLGIAGGIFLIFIQYVYRNILKIGKIVHSQELILTVFYIYCSQGIDDRRRIAFRIAFIALRFLALYIAAAYSADIIAYLSIRIPNIPFTSLHSFIKNGKNKMLLPPEDVSLFKYFNNSKSSVLKKIATDLSYPPTEDYIRIKNLCSSQKFALPTYGINNAFWEVPCQIYRIPKIISYHFYGIMLGSPGTPSTYSRILNNYFLRLREAGIFQEIETMTTIKIYEPEEELRAIEINQAVQLFQIVLTGSVFSLIIFFCEIFFNIIVKCVKNNRRVINNVK